MLLKRQWIAGQLRRSFSILGLLIFTGPILNFHAFGHDRHYHFPHETFPTRPVPIALYSATGALIPSMGTIADQNFVGSLNKKAEDKIRESLDLNESPKNRRRAAL